MEPHPPVKGNAPALEGRGQRACVRMGGHATRLPNARAAGRGVVKMLKGRKILDDAAMLAGGAMNLLSAGRAQVKREARDRVAAMAERLDLVPREDFERMEAMLVRLREEQEVLKKRLAALEGGADNTPPSAMQKKAGAAPTTAKTTARRGKKPS